MADQLNPPCCGKGITENRCGPNHYMFWTDHNRKTHNGKTPDMGRHDVPYVRGFLSCMLVFDRRCRKGRLSEQIDMQCVRRHFRPGCYPDLLLRLGSLLLFPLGAKHRASLA